MKLLIVGLDGFTWSVANPLIEANRMPNLARLISGGAKGILRSFEPMLSPILWTDIATGKLPEKHGMIHYFETSASIRTKRLWDILEQPGRPVGLWSWPVTWPPRPINGFIVPSLFARDTNTYPPNLRFVKELEEGMRKSWGERVRLIREAMRHGLRLKTVAGIVGYALGRKLGRYDGLDSFVALRTLKLDIHLDIYERLVEQFKPYFTSFYLNQTDAFGHLFWRYYEPEFFPNVSPGEVQKYGDMVPYSYEMADRALGRLIELTNDDTLIVVLSDHGFQAELSDQDVGLVARAKGDRLMEALALDGQATYVNYRRYVLLSVRDNRPAVVNKLRQFRVEEMDRPIFNVRESHLGSISVYVAGHEKGIYTDVDLGSLHVVWPEGRLPFLELISPTYNIRQSGTHHPDGMIVFHGPGVRVGEEVSGTLIDVVPTVLALLGMPVGLDMDGKVIESAISPGFLEETPTTYIDTYDTDFELDETEEDLSVSPELLARLRALGYVE
jgi:hypothetical protein